MFGRIGSFFKEAVAGVFEILGETFAAAPAARRETPASPRSDEALPRSEALEPPSCAAPAGRAGAGEFGAAGESVASGEPVAAGESRESGAAAEGDKAAPLRGGEAVAAKPRNKNAGAGRKAAPRGKLRPPDARALENSETAPIASAGDAPTRESAVARRYRTLKAEGLTPKEANEYSRSSKKYELYRHLSTTGPGEGAQTHWEMLREFDRKAALHLARIETAGEEAASFKLQVAAARDALLAKYLSKNPGEGKGRPAGAPRGNSAAAPEEGMGQAETVAKMIGLDKF